MGEWVLLPQRPSCLSPDQLNKHLLVQGPRQPLPLLYLVWLLVGEGTCVHTPDRYSWHTLVLEGFFLNVFWSGQHPDVSRWWCYWWSARKCNKQSHRGPENVSLQFVQWLLCFSISSPVCHSALSVSVSTDQSDSVVPSSWDVSLGNSRYPKSPRPQSLKLSRLLL